MTKSNGWINVIYNSYSEISLDLGTYNNDDWINKQKNRVKNFDKERDITIKRNKLLIDTVNSIEKRKISILDYGGGFGLSYLPLIESTDKNIEYHIIEVPKVSNAASEFYSNNQSISFSHCFQEACKKEYDIGYIRTSLQYANDWKLVLKSISSFMPEKIVLSDASIGNIKTFLTFQSWGSQKIPYWFINEDELIKTITSLGYLLEKNSISRDIRYDDSWKTQRKYPKEYRIDSIKNLIFSRV